MADDFKNYITPRGFERLKRERHQLRLVERPQVVDTVHWAASLGDRSENADYKYGKKRLREIDRRLRWLDKRMMSAEIVDPGIDRGEVVYFGAIVVLGYADGTERTCELVGEDEIEVELGRISWRSPMGRVLMRKREGDTVVLKHLGERIEVEILEVDYQQQTPDPPPAAKDTGPRLQQRS